MTLNDLEGVYIHSPQPGEQQKIKDTVESTLSEFNPLFRRIARPKLEKGARIDSRIEVDIQHENVVLTHINDKRVVLNLPLNKEVKNKTENLRHHISWVDNKLERRDSSFFGGREVTYELINNGDILNIKVKMFGAQLPEPIVYTLKYLRHLVK